MSAERSGPDVAGDAAAAAVAADGVHFPRFHDAEVARIGREIARTGACRLDDVIPAAMLDEARRQAEAAVVANGGEYVARIGRLAETGYLLSDIHADPDFLNLLGGLYSAATGQAPPAGHVHQVLRCLMGRTARRHAGYLHYDSYVVTILISLAVPAQGETGDLILLPDRRPIRRSYLANAVEKLLLDRAPVQRWLWRRIESGRAPVLRLKMQPGSILIFGGYRGLHANAPSDPRGLRATLLYHFGNPHETSRLRRWCRRD